MYLIEISSSKKREPPNSSPTQELGRCQSLGDGVDSTFFELQQQRVLINPDVVEYEEDEMKPVFDLTLGVKTMHELLGIFLDC